MKSNDNSDIIMMFTGSKNGSLWFDVFSNAKQKIKLGHVRQWRDRIELHVPDASKLVVLKKMAYLEKLNREALRSRHPDFFNKKLFSVQVEASFNRSRVIRSSLKSLSAEH